MDFVQEVDVLNEEVEHRDDDLLTAAVGHLGPLRGPLQGCAVVAEVAGWVHVVLQADGRIWWAGLPLHLSDLLRTPLCRKQLWAAPYCDPQEAFSPGVGTGEGSPEAPG